MDYVYDFILESFEAILLTALAYVAKKFWPSVAKRWSTTSDNRTPATRYLKARGGLELGGRLTVSVRPSKLYDDTEFRKLDEQLDRRMAEVERWFEQENPGWSRSLFP